MKTPTDAAIPRFLSRISTPLVSVAAVILGGFLLTDLAIPDFVPFVDEALLALLFTGAVAELLKRRRAPDPASPLPPGS